MLLNQKSAFTPGNEPAQSGTSGAIFDRYIRIARRQYVIILSCLLLASLVGAIYLFATRPVYTAVATMMIDPRKGGIQQKSVLGDTPTDTAVIDSQIGVLSLERDQIGIAVTKKLQLAKDPDFAAPIDGLSGALLALLPKSLQVRIPEKPKSDTDLTQQVAYAVAGGLDVRRVGFTYLVTISFSGPN